MRERLFNYAFPVGGGSMGAISPIVTDITWHGVGDMAAQAAIFAFVGGLIGWAVKHCLDRIVKKKK